MSVTFGCIPVELLPTVWPDVAELLRRSVATAGGKFELDDVRKGIASGELVLWLAVDGSEPIAAITTRIILYPQRRAMAMDWIGGRRMREWLPLAQETLSRFARANDCRHLEGYGRPAWGRWLEKYNWKPEYIAYRMELTDG